MDVSGANRGKKRGAVWILRCLFVCPEVVLLISLCYDLLSMTENEASHAIFTMSVSCFSCSLHGSWMKNVISSARTLDLRLTL